MQRVGAAGGPGPIGFQGPPRSLKISPVNIQDEPSDPTQSKYSVAARSARGDEHRAMLFPKWESQYVDMSGVRYFESSILVNLLDVCSD